MSIQSTVGNITHSVQDGFNEISNRASSTLQGIVGTISTSVTNLYSGGFVGLSREGMAELDTALEEYIGELEETINGFNEEADAGDAYAGQIKTAVHEYVVAVQALLSAYVTRLRQEIDEANEAFNNMHQADQDISQNVTSDAGDVTSDAQSIRVDSSTISLD